MTTTAHELLRYTVTGDTPGAEYLVDLASFDGNGRCNCEDFRIRKEPEIRAAIESRTFHPGDAWRCKHIHQCRQHLTNQVITEFRRQYGNNNDD